MNIAYIINEYLEALGWKGLTVTESINPTKMCETWTVYANKRKIGEFQTEINESNNIRSYVANTAIAMLAMKQSIERCYNGKTSQQQEAQNISS